VVQKTLDNFYLLLLMKMYITDVEIRMPVDEKKRGNAPFFMRVPWAYFDPLLILFLVGFPMKNDSCADFL